MRVITVPPNVTVERPRKVGNDVEFTLEERSFTKFLQECFDSYATFSKGHVNALIYQKLTKVLTETDLSKGELWFEDEDFKKLEAAVGSVEWITPKFNLACIPFYEAVKSARTETLSTDKRPK